MNTFTTEADFRQERDFSQKITASFEFIRAHWRPLGRALLVIVLPATLLQSILAAIFQSAMFKQLRNADGSATSRLEQLSTFTSPTYWGSILLGMVVYVLLVLTVYGYIAARIAKTDPAEEVTPGEVWAVVRQHFLSSVLSMWALGFLLIVGMLLLLAPGIYLGVATSLFFMVKVMENAGFSESMQRSMYLVKGKWWSTAGLIFISSMVLYLLIIVLSLPFSLLGLRSVLSTDAEISSTLLVVGTAIQQIVIMAAYPFMLLPLAFQYFSQVERKENRGMYALVDQLGQQPAVAGNGASAAWRPDEEGEY